MAIGVPGHSEYGGSREPVWCSLDGNGMVRVEIRRADQESVLMPPAQALELAKVLQELAEQCTGFRIEDDC
jgi:hypothetical protein